jgi:ferredoxin-fold anticodon binding domain-containing protein
LALKTLFDADIIDVKEGVAFVEEHPFELPFKWYQFLGSPSKS